MTTLFPVESPRGIKRKIDNSTKEWASTLETVLPIDTKDIPHFQSWINWNGFSLDPAQKEHTGFDFAAYQDTNGNIVFGLPERTPIRAVADGRILQVMDSPEWSGGGYATMVSIEHGANDSGMASRYTHVIPRKHFAPGTEIKQGEIIGTLFKDPGNQQGRLVHLHLELIDGWGTHGTNAVLGGGLNKRLRDPIILEDNLKKHQAIPQGSSQFTVPGLPDSNIITAHFQRVLIKN